jgi:predicted nucleotidyltransferase
LIDLSNKPDLRWLSSLIGDIREAAPEGDFMLTGAKARDLLLTHAHSIAIERATEDVDVAFAVRGWDEFAALRESLLAGGRFVERGNVQHRMYHQGPGQTRVDLIPFADIEDANRQIAWPPDGAVVMNVIGFREAHRAAVRVLLPNTEWINVTPIHALVLLKLAAWKDRRVTSAGKDAQDIRLLLRCYIDAGNQTRLYEEASHLLEAPDFDLEEAGAWLLGHDAATLLLEPAPGAAAGFFLGMIEAEVGAEEESILLSDMRSATPSKDMAMLRAFHEGLSTRLSQP